MRYAIVVIGFAESAFRHNIGRDRIMFVVENYSSRIDLPEEGDLVMFLGDDWRGVPLEVGAIERDDGNLLIVHAMRMRRKYRGDFEGYR